MTNSILTPNSPDPNTQLTVPVLGWQLISSNLANIFAGANLVYTATGGASGGWYPDFHPVPGDTSNPTLWRLIFNKPGWPSVEINDTDWFAFDGKMPIQVSAAHVTANYTVTTQGA